MTEDQFGFLIIASVLVVLTGALGSVIKESDIKSRIEKHYTKCLETNLTEVCKEKKKYGLSLINEEVK